MKALSTPDLIAFDCLFDEKFAAAYSWDMWGAAYLINGGCSDDGFDYFLAWLIGRGRAVYEAAVAAPDALAGHTDPDRDDHEFEELLYVAQREYEKRTGDGDVPGPAVLPDCPPDGDWDFDDGDLARRKLPRLAAMYLDAD